LGEEEQTFSDLNILVKEFVLRAQKIGDRRLKSEKKRKKVIAHD
jgi:hypothetical protein